MNYISDDTKQLTIDLLNTALWKAETKLRAEADPTRENQREAFAARRSWAHADVRFHCAIDDLAAERYRMGAPIERPPERLVREDTLPL